MEKAGLCPLTTINQRWKSEENLLIPSNNHVTILLSHTKLLENKMVSFTASTPHTSQQLSPFLHRRPRRNRQHPAIRNLIEETFLQASDFIQPHFVIGGQNQRSTISSLPHVERLSIDLTLKEVERLLHLGIQGILLFSVNPPEVKCEQGKEAWNPNGLLQRSVSEIKKHFPEMLVCADVALDPFTSHGHDGLLREDGQVDNDSSLVALGKMSLSLAEAGADLIAPSDMMDGRVGYLRHLLDAKDFTEVGILAYTAKYASKFYGPFRDALGSAPKSGDKKGYQLNPANQREALLEAQLDESEGADILMVKPAMSYLDIIYQIRQQTQLPIAAYQVSGEYAMIWAADQLGWLDGEEILKESLLSIKRAGADILVSYGAKRICQNL